MEIQQIIALMTFAFVSTITPGPNNIMLMTSGANVGFTRTVPHMLGIIFGFNLMIILVGLGLMEVFNQYPIVQTALQVGCISYLVYLALQIALSKPEANNSTNYRPMSFLAAANFQWINPKAWSIALTAISVYNISGNWQGVILVSVVFAVINIPSATVWTIAGQKLQSFLTGPNTMRYFNYGMASLLLISTLMMT